MSLRREKMKQLAIEQAAAVWDGRPLSEHEAEAVCIAIYGEMQRLKQTRAV